MAPERKRLHPLLACALAIRPFGCSLDKSGRCDDSFSRCCIASVRSAADVHQCNSCSRKVGAPGGDEMFFMRQTVYLLALAIAMLAATRTTSAQSSFDLRSPDGKIEVRIRTAKGLRYDVLRNGSALLEDSTASIDIDHKTLGRETKVRNAKESSHDEILEPVVRQKFAKIRDNYKELRLDMDGGYAFLFRAYN